MLALTHRWVLHAVVYVAIELGALSALEDELDHFKAISLIDCPVITLHAKVFEDKVGAFFQQGVIEALEIEFV